MSRRAVACRSAGLGLVPEERRHGEAKSGEERLAVELITAAEDADPGRRLVDVDLGPPGVDEPDLLDARLEVFVQLVDDLVGRAARAHDLDRQVRDDVPGGLPR